MRDNDFETKTSKLWAKDKTKSQQIHYLIWISSLTFPLLDQVMVSWLEGGGGGGAVHRLTFASVDEILWCYHSNETSSAVLSHGSIYLVCSSTLEVFRWKSFGVTIDTKSL